MDNARSRFEHEARSPETAPLAKLVDKIYCKLQAVNSLLPSADINRQSRVLVNHIVRLHAEYHAEQLRKGFEDVQDYCEMGNVVHRYVTAVKQDSGTTVGHTFLKFAISEGILTATIHC